jgi:hypothetical protein
MALEVPRGASRSHGHSHEPAATLREAQAAFLDALRASEESLPERSLFATPPAEATAQDRWGIYRNAYRTRLTETLGEDYPAVARILGPAAFTSLAARYLAAHPPSSHDISRAGDRLPEFLLADPLRAELPFLADLARFEASLAAAVVASDFAPPGRAELARRIEAIVETPLALAPGAAYLDSRWPLADLWACRDLADEEISLEVEGRPSRLAVFRDGLAVRWRAVSDDEAALLAALAEERTLLSFVESGSFGEPGSAAPRFAEIALRLLVEGIVQLSTGRSTASTTQGKESSS